MTPKQDALHAIERLPDDVPIDEIVYPLYVLSKVQQGGGPLPLQGTNPSFVTRPWWKFWGD